MPTDIVNGSTRALLYSSPAANTVGEAVVEAIRRGADLRGADLTGAYLTGADLRGAVLTDADLRGAYLRGAYLTGAYLRGADLTGADLRGADLRGADLTGADLWCADLRGADLTGADLTAIRDDFWAVLAAAPNEIAALRAALREGRVDGSTYNGECACLVGTIANARHCAYDQVPGLAPNGERPAERFFLAINKGDTPETSQAAKIAVEWLDDFDARMRAGYWGGAVHAN